MGATPHKYLRTTTSDTATGKRTAARFVLGADYLPSICSVTKFIKMSSSRLQHLSYLGARRDSFIAAVVHNCFHNIENIHKPYLTDIGVCLLNRPNTNTMQTIRMGFAY